MLDKVPILSIETSQTCCGACVFIDDDKFFEMSLNLKNVHAEKIFEVIDNVIKISGVNRTDLGAIAISAGPGSFTGLRIGMSAAKGIAFGLSLPIIPVPSFEALAFQLSNQLSEGTKFILANKVNSEEVYFAKFKVKANSYIFVQDLQIVKSTENINPENDCIIFGNAVSQQSPTENILKVSSPKPEFVARWAKYFGKDKLLHEFDLLEPNYLKEFIIKDKGI